MCLHLEIYHNPSGNLGHFGIEAYLQTSRKMYYMRWLPGTPVLWRYGEPSSSNGEARAGLVWEDFSPDAMQDTVAVDDGTFSSIHAQSTSHTFPPEDSSLYGALGPV